MNDTISSGYMDDRVWGSNLLLATDSPGHNAQPDVWGSGLAVAIGAGTVAQRARLSAALAANSSTMFKWGQARSLPWPMCWQQGGAMMPMQPFVLLHSTHYTQIRANAFFSYCSTPVQIERA